MGIRDLNSFTVEAAGVTLTSGFNNLGVCSSDTWPVGPCIRHDTEPIKFKFPLGFCSMA